MIVMMVIVLSALMLVLGAGAGHRLALSRVRPARELADYQAAVELAAAITESPDPTLDPEVRVRAQHLIERHSRCSLSRKDS